MPTQAPLPRSRKNRSELSESIAEQWRRMRVLPEQDLGQSVIIGELTESYNVREAHEIARRKRDPYLSPHGMFRGLAVGNRKQAVEFLETFGPLRKSHRNIVRVELATFWEEHLRFCLVARLYENRDATKPLRKALEEYLRHTSAPQPTDTEIKEVVAAMVASGPTMKAKMAKFGVRNFKELIRAEELEFARNPPPQGEESRPRNNDEAPLWDTETMLHRLDQGDDPRAMALYFVAKEIQYHTKDIHFTWAQGRARQQDKFRFYRRLDYDSLLSAIWDLFAADTAGVPWRICPNDQNVFYPPRADRFYCTSAEQVAASKADYDRRRKRKRRQKSRG